MASSIRLCTVKKCDEASCAVCHCCQKDLCLDHLKEHRDQLNSKLDPLVNRINTSAEMLKHFDMKSLSCFTTIEQWRVAAHQIIDQFCERISNDCITQKKNESMEKLSITQKKLDHLIRKKGATYENIESLEKELCAIEQQIDALRNTQINLRPLVIDESVILQAKQPTRKATVYRAQVEMGKKREEPDLERNFQIFVATTMNELMTITIKPSDTIETIKREIERRKSIPVDRQRLEYMGKQLKNKLTAANYDLQPLCTINLRHNLLEKNKETQNT